MENKSFILQLFADAENAETAEEAIDSAKERITELENLLARMEMSRKVTDILKNRYKVNADEETIQMIVGNSAEETQRNLKTIARLMKWETSEEESSAPDQLRINRDMNEKDDPYTRIVQKYRNNKYFKK